MPSDAMQGTTLTFAGVAIADISSIRFIENGNAIDTTDISDAVHKFLNGVKSIELVVTIFGTFASAIGATGTISLTWNDGTVETGGGLTFMLDRKNPSGNVGGAITTELTFVPYGG